MRILGVTPYWPPAGGGLERYARETFTRLAARGHDVRVVAFDATGGAREADDEGVSLRLLPLRRRVSNTPLEPRLPRILRDEIERTRPDVVAPHGPVPGPIEAAGLAVGTRAALVPTVHAGLVGGGASGFRGALLAALGRIDRATLFARAVRRADGLVATSEYVRQRLLACRLDAATVVPPGVDLARFVPGPRPDPTRVLFVGPLDRAYRWKGFHVLYEAVRRARLRLVAVGAGDELDAWRARARREGADVELRGRLAEPDLVAAYREAGVVALPSLGGAEAFGMVLAEGAACARPLVASAVGGIPTIVRDGANGLLVPPGDAPALADALRALADDPDRAAEMGRAGRALVEQEHGWERLVDRTETALLLALLQRDGARREQALLEVAEAGVGR